MEGVIVVATSTAGSGGRVGGEISATVAGAPTVGVDAVGTTDGAAIAGAQVMAVGGAIARIDRGARLRETIAGGPIEGMIVAGGPRVLIVNAGATLGHAIFGGEGTNLFNKPGT